MNPTPSAPLTRLSELAVGTPALIHGIAEAAPANVSMRLRHLGFRTGNAVQPLRVAPLGDPTVYRILGYDLCLRRHEACHIQVEVTP
ncbi:FeoA family protein [Mycolicibacterium palauense]|uniref:FeoA family protein n=1 Tax=Mycolicibacterium palauense TaxID=2034511 RepID=UPI000BFF016C|nr:FeoA family protein [Mycolicibacterium palauense]